MEFPIRSHYSDISVPGQVALRSLEKQLNDIESKTRLAADYHPSNSKQKECGVMTNLEGKWKYQSYRPDPVSVSSDAAAPTFVKWSPLGVVMIDAGGITGKLEFPGTPLKLDLKLEVIDGKPERVSISAAMKLSATAEFTNELTGCLVPAELGQSVDDGKPLAVRGSIVLTSKDIAQIDPQPIYTTGYFVLERHPG
jgi:hypothetical protein